MHAMLTVSPVFSRSNKSMLQKAFSYAGFNKNYSFVNEQEAILSYWKYMWSGKQSLPNNVDLNNENGFLLVNLKGSTALISANSTKDGILHRLAYVAGGGWGGQAVHEELKQFIIKIVGAPVFLRYIEQAGGLFDFERYVESAFNYFDKNNEMNFRLSLNHLCQQEYNEDFKTAVKESPFSHGVSVRSNTGIISIKRDVVNSFLRTR
ncbi:uncharacterized protein LOC132745890 [Ruditapes philippinarum]|uniref:uncharacterized protein LOC132745890 n=1 Tax=Ruditapes philippinarum TaxID=129788 RepID=UPI00295A5A74|nr:uncharacterized protein LOC132745890 [Ruditapes philippinarum]